MQHDNTLYILNEHNKFITIEYIETLFKQYGIDYKVNNIEIFKRATTHTSYIHKPDDYWQQHKSKTGSRDLDPISDASLAIPLQKVSLEELELLGDGVIHLILVDYFGRRYAGQGEGFITKLRTKIENGDTLSHFCRAIKLNQYILLSRYIEKNNGRQENCKIMEDAFEAFIGAVYMDIAPNSDTPNFNSCRNFIINLIEQEVDISEILFRENNYKDLLLQHFHIKKWCDPFYNKLNTSGIDHNKIFTVSVTKKVNMKDIGEICGIGIGTSKKKAEQDAAMKALQKLGLAELE
jgi:ribonuclease III